MYSIEKINQPNKPNKPFLYLYSTFTFLEDPTDNMSALVQLNTLSSLKPLPQLMMIPVPNWYSCHYILMIQLLPTDISGDIKDYWISKSFNLTKSLMNLLEHFVELIFKKSLRIISVYVFLYPRWLTNREKTSEHLFTGYLLQASRWCMVSNTHPVVRKFKQPFHLLIYLPK